MNFDTLLGNDRLKQNLAESLAKNHISHFYLISGPRGSGKHTLSALLAQSILCRGHRKPCGTCDACRKFLSGNHPDHITVIDPDHKNVSVRIVREYRETMFVLPNESDHKIYVFPQDLGIEGQNTLLKILEEPPSYGVFLLLAENPEKLLPTVRSRCTELKLQALPESVLLEALARRFPNHQKEDLSAAALRSGGFLGQAMELLEGGCEYPPQTVNFVDAIRSKNPLALAELMVPLEKAKREELLLLLQSWLELTEESLSFRMGMSALSPLSRQLGESCTAPELYAIIGHLKKALEYTMSNVSPAAVCGWLVWALR